MSYFICHFIGVRKISRSKGLKSGQGGRSFSAERKAGCFGEKEKKKAVWLEQHPERGRSRR